MSFDDKALEIPASLPMLPVRDIVVFPYMIIPLFVGRDASIQAVEESLSKTKMNPGAMLIGTVIDIENDMVIVSTHSKSEGVIPKWQFLNNDSQYCLPNLSNPNVKVKSNMNL